MRDIGNELHKAEKTISRILKDNNIMIRPAYKTTYDLYENFFDEINTQEKAYIVGFILADGCVYKNTLSISLKYDDIDILEKINNACGSNRPIRKIDGDILVQNGKEYICSDQYKLVITNKYFVNQLKEKGI